MSKEVVKVENVSMKFNLMENKVDNLKEYVIKLLKMNYGIRNSGL